MKIKQLIPVFGLIGALSLHAETEPATTPHPSGKTNIDNRENADVDPASKVLPSTGMETAEPDKALNPSGKTGTDSAMSPADEVTSKKVEKKAAMKKDTTESMVSEADATFLKKAAKGGMAEVELSKLADANASKSEVKEFATMMVSDHTGANAKVKTLAKAKGVSLPAKLDKKHQAKYAELKDKKGAEFDAEYLKVQTADHEETVALFEKQAASGDDAEIKAFAKKTLPTLKTHLKLVKSL